MSLDKYLNAFAHLRMDAVPNRWPVSTKYKAPHKPLLLLSILDLFAENVFTNNLITLNEELAELFTIYWSKVMPHGQRGNIALPFFHLKSEKFWHLILKPEHAVFQGKKGQFRSINQLREIFIGAKLDEELFVFLSNETERNRLKNVLIEAYFSSEIQPVLIEQGMINVEAFQYSLNLLTKSEIEIIKEATPYQQEQAVPIRSQGFRTAIVKVYNHRCAICGIRALSPDGHTVVDAAHIIPWSISHNDHPKNGIALCKLCHWMFDEGLVTLSSEYFVIISQQLSIYPNIPGHLVTVDGRVMIQPENKEFLPDLDSLKWHRQIVFCKA